MVRKLVIFGISLLTFGLISPCFVLADGDCVPSGFGDDCKVSEVKVPGSDKKQEDALLHTIQTAINWVLGLLAVISSVLCLYAGFKMLTSGGDSKKYGDGLGILKGAALGLAIIGTSWLIVSLVFYVIMGSVNPNIG